MEHVKFKNHVLICGLGHIGYRVFEILSRLDQQICVISNKTQDEWKYEVVKSGGHYFHGNAENDELLKLAGIEHAATVIAATDQDLVNISIALDAKKLNPKIKIVVRLFDLDLGKRLSGAIDISDIFSTSFIAAPGFIHRSANDNILGYFSILEKTYQVLESQAQDAKSQESKIGSIAVELLRNESKHRNLFFEKLKSVFFYSWIPKSIRSVVIFLISIIIVSSFVFHYGLHLSWSNAVYFVITTITTVGYGDFSFANAPLGVKIFGCFLMLSGAGLLATVFGIMTDFMLKEKLINLKGGKDIPNKGHVVLVGGGNIGFRIAELLIELGREVVIIDDGSTRAGISGTVKRHVAIVDGDPRSEETLREANILRAGHVIAVSEDDLSNLSVGLAAKKQNDLIDTSVRCFDYNLARKMKGQLKLDRVLSVSGVSSPYFAAAAFCENVKFASVWENKLLIISGATPNPSLASIHNLKTRPLTSFGDSSVETYYLSLLEFQNEGP